MRPTIAPIVLVVRNPFLIPVGVDVGNDLFNRPFFVFSGFDVPENDALGFFAHGGGN
jgi:hypothetical protein